jgi:polyphosphate:AMP phosphotransferase
MLETLDLDLKLGKADGRAAIEKAGIALSILQRSARENGVPVILVFEGWDGAGKGDSIAALVEHMDPRGFNVFAPRQASEDEAMRPRLWRFWRRLPGRGEMTIFDRSWYHDLTIARLDGTLDRVRWERAVDDAKDFERQLTDDGTLLVKFWLHISRKEQRRRIEAWAKEPYQRWRTREPLGMGRLKYKKVLGVMEETLALTNTHSAPWVLVEAENDRYRRAKVIAETAAALRGALMVRGVTPPEPLSEREIKKSAGRVKRHPDPLRKLPVISGDSPLARIDLSLKLGRPRYVKELRTAQETLRDLEFAAYVKRLPVVIVFEGWDASGKGGAIKRFTEHLDPRGYAVIPIAKPEGDAARRHYLWRFWERLPKAGHIAIFDRSWYGRVLVERVEGFCSEAQWRRAYEEINEFEQALTDDGVAIVKFWLHLSPQEQLRRFRDREASPIKSFKIGPEDWRNRAKWPQYLEAVSDMLRRTSTRYAPWTIVEADDKLHARVKVVRVAVKALKERL